MILNQRGRLFNPTPLPPDETHHLGNQGLAELQVQTLQSVTDLGRRMFGAAACSLALLEPDDEHLRFRRLAARVLRQLSDSGCQSVGESPAGLCRRASPSLLTTYAATLASQDVAESTGTSPTQFLRPYGDSQRHTGLA